MSKVIKFPARGRFAQATVTRDELSAMPITALAVVVARSLVGQASAADRLAARREVIRRNTEANGHARRP